MNELTIKLSTGEGERLYEQIYQHIKKEIQAGKFLQGEKLPSTRSLAEQLLVSRTTIDMAYDQLLSEGYIEARPYRGYFVCRLEDLFQLQENKWQETKERNATDQKVKESILYDFSPTAVDMELFPFATWRKITRSILSDASSGLFSLGEPQGDYDLRTTIVRYLHASRGVNCEPEQLVIGAGNDYLLMLLEKIFEKKQIVAMENPTYIRAYRIFQSFGYHVEALPVDRGGIKMESLEECDADIAYIMPSHQYPTGRVMPIGRRMELLRWAAGKSDRYLIEDDYDSELRFKGKPIPSLQASDTTGKVIYIGTFSKSIAPAIRISFMVLPKQLLERYHKNCYFYSSTVSRIDQSILNEFISGGYFERYLNKMRKFYRCKHDCLLEELKPFRKNFKISGEDAGLHVILSDKTGRRTEEELLAGARTENIRLYGMSETLVENSGKEKDQAQVILGFGSLSEEQIQSGIRALKKAWAQWL
ncbi:MAG: PLP-dependent aminotransferase family protein [Lachnospiraceae bacterium]|nr:PLP-dependent aminotransferase family protein [Lachnospiraceae bacterium]